MCVGTYTRTHIYIHVCVHMCQRLSHQQLGRSVVPSTEVQKGNFCAPLILIETIIT